MDPPEPEYAFEQNSQVILYTLTFENSPSPFESAFPETCILNQITTTFLHNSPDGHYYSSLQIKKLDSGG